MEINLLTQIGVTISLLAYIWNDAKKRNEKTEAKVEMLKEKTEALDKRAQKIEDIQGSKLDVQNNKIDTLAADFKEFKHDVNDKLDALTVMVHKDKNMEGQLNQTLGLLLKQLTKHDEANN